MLDLYWAREETKNGKLGVLVRYPFKGIALTMAEEAAKKQGRNLLEQWPNAIIAEDGATEWFFQYAPQ